MIETTDYRCRQRHDGKEANNGTSVLFTDHVIDTYLLYNCTISFIIPCPVSTVNRLLTPDQVTSNASTVHSGK